MDPRQESSGSPIRTLPARASIAISHGVIAAT
jgi:hypothetical protein